MTGEKIDSTKEKTDAAAIDPKNIIEVKLDDLSEEDRRQLEQELEEEKADWMKQKLACFQKTRNGTLKKVINEVNKSSCSNEIANLIDTSVASKFGTDMSYMAQTITETVRNDLAMFKEQFSRDIQNSLPCQIRTEVLHINDEHSRKQPV